MYYYYYTYRCGSSVYSKTQKAKDSLKQASIFEYIYTIQWVSIFQPDIIYNQTGRFQGLECIIIIYNIL